MIYPKLSVIMPSFNQVDYIEASIKSVIDQNYPNLEFIIIDGGSTDGSVDIIKKYQSQISHWVSEPDQGQANAINKGLKMATGDWLCWQNSDDIYDQDCFASFAKLLESRKEADLVCGNLRLIDQNGGFIRDVKYTPPVLEEMLAEGMLIANQSSFWRRFASSPDLMNETMHYSFDYEFFLRLVQKYKCVHSPSLVGCLRVHGEAKSSTSRNAFAMENERIRLRFPRNRYPAFFFQIRRFFKLLAYGEVSYALRGVMGRIWRGF